MKNILKFLFVSLLIPIIFTSCRDDANNGWTSVQPSFKLYDTTLGSNTLYPTMDNNPFILTWDNTVKEGGTYTVVLSSTGDFSNKVVLGTSDTNVYKTTIKALNTAMLQVGIEPYGSQMAYIRIENGSLISNTINFQATPYPVSIPVIKYPLNGQIVTLNSNAPTAQALAITWSDYTYGTNVNYKVQIAPHGSSTFTLLGTTTNNKELALTNFALNEAVLKLGAQVGVAMNFDIKVTAETSPAGGPITKTSEIVSFQVIPYKPAFVPMYIVGGFNDPYFWKAGIAPKLLQTSNISEMYAYFQNGTDFRFLGQQDWNPLNFALNATGTNDSNKYFNTWSSNLQASGNENIKFTGESGIYKILIDQNSRDIKLTPYNNNIMPTDLYLVGTVNSWSASQALMMEMIDFGIFRYTGVQLNPDSAFKFLGQQDWTGQEWGNIHGPGNLGLLGPNGDNGDIKFAGDGGLYNITVNIAFGTYTITKQ